MKKNLLKGILTVAAVATVMIGGNKMTANAMTIEEFAAWGGLTVEQVKADAELYSFYQDIKCDDISMWTDDGSATAATASAVTTPAVAGVAVSHPEMLALVNADREVNGAGALVYSTDLEVIANQRAVEVMANFQSTEMANAIAANDYDAQCRIGHQGVRAGTSENAIWITSYGCETADTANIDWINSAGHHSNRIKADWTQYAAASYVDPVTGQETWVEVFADNSYKGPSTFDSARYVTDYPALAAASGNNQATTSIATTAGVPVSHPEMLALVNADRAANGTGTLVWNAGLEAYCISRLPVAMNNFHSVEYANARAAGDYAAKSAIGHSGAYERENLAWTGGSFGTDTAERHNTRWIESTGHHNSRITAGLTQYACASYVDPVTGDEVWIEAFK